MEYFDLYTDLKIFKRIPAVSKQGICVADAADYGDENYVISLSRTSADTYREYLAVLDADGFSKYAENDINGDVFAATYTKENLVLTVSFMARTGEMYISAKEDLPLSAHLRFDEELLAGIVPGAKTVLSMHQVPEYGNCYVLKLKNGHFIVNDGGFPGNLEPLLDTLEQEAGGKPVVEAWFVSHEHWDHAGVLDKLATDGFADRIFVDGIYVSQVSAAARKITVPETSQEVGTCKRSAPALKTAAGETTPVYRVHAGERYYFCDISVDVLYTQEQFRLDRYVSNLNVSSTWLMYNIEGQKFLLCGDTELPNMRDCVKLYDRAYWDVDIMNVHHHGLNLYIDDLGYFKAKTMLYSTWGTYSIYWRPKVTLEQNLTIQKEHCQEFMSYMDGGKRLTFPYEVGTAENLSPWYQEMSDMCTARQEKWLREAGLL